MLSIVLISTGSRQGFLRLRKSMLASLPKAEVWQDHERTLIDCRAWRSSPQN